MEKVKKHLSSIYRVFLRTGEIEIYVNGEKAIYHRVNKCFMGIEVKEGINIIEMHYVSSGFNIGLIISVAGLLILLVKYIVFRRNKENYIKKC